jgi:hypothetical protein
VRDARVVAGVEEAFRFLVEAYGFRRYRVAHTDAGLVVKFRNETTGVVIETGAGGMEVLVTRLDSAGRMPPVDRDGYAFWWWLLADLAGDEVDPGTPPGEQAELLRLCGDRALRGDFGGLDEAATRRIPELADG